MIKYFSIIIISILATTSFTNAQNGAGTAVRDLETWSSAAINYKLNKKLEFGLNQQLRLKDNSSKVDIYFTQLSAQYKFYKGLSLSGAARFIRENDDEGKIKGYENHLRWQADLGYKHDLGRFEMKYRLRYQTKGELNVASENISDAFRLKLGTKYNIKSWKLDPGFYTEIFNDLETNKFYKIRYTLSTDYNLKKAGEIGAFFRVEQGLMGTNKNITNIIGVQYQYTLKHKK